MAQDGAVRGDAASCGLFVHDHVVRQRRADDGASLAALHQAAARGDGQNVEAARDHGDADAQAEFFRDRRIDRADDLVGRGDRSELALHLRQAQLIEQFRLILLRVDVHQRGGSVGSVRADVAGQFEVEPVLAVEDPGDLLVVLRFVLLQPREFGDVGAGEQRRRVHGDHRRVDGVVVHDRSRIVPEHGVAHRTALRVDAPQTVTLGGDTHGGNVLPYGFVIVFQLQDDFFRDLPDRVHIHFRSAGERHQDLGGLALDIGEFTVQRDQTCLDAGGSGIHDEKILHVHLLFFILVFEFFSVEIVFYVRNELSCMVRDGVPGGAPDVRGHEHLVRHPEKRMAGRDGFL